MDHFIFFATFIAGATLADGIFTNNYPKTFLSAVAIICTFLLIAGTN